MKTALCSAMLVLGLAGCAGSGSSGTPLVPDQKIVVSKALSVSLSNVVGAAAIAGAIYIIYDPLAPNWEIEEQRLNDDTYRLTMKMKRYHTGGAGESMQIFRRRAMQLQSEQGFAHYQILDYSEGIDSQTLGARRFAEGTIRLGRR